MLQASQDDDLALRDIPYRRYVILFLVGGLAPAVTDALPRALHETVRLLPRGIGEKPRSPGTLRSPVRILSDELTDDELIAASNDLGGAPVALTLAGDRAVIALGHRGFDGATALTLLHDLLDRACGIEPVPDPRPDARLPMLTLLRHTGPAAVRQFRDRRVSGRVSGRVAAIAPDAVPRFITFRLEADLVRTVQRTRGAGRGRATLNTKLCSAVLEALRAAQRAPGDLRVRVPVDLRHLVPGRRIRGNFVCGDAIGTLHGDGWSPADLSARLLEASGPSGAVSLATSYPRHLAAEVVHVRHRPAPAINVSLVSSGRPFPAAAWSGAERTLACISAGESPSPVFVFVWSVDGAVHVTVYDETGIFDIGGFDERLRTLLVATYVAV